MATKIKLINKEQLDLNIDIIFNSCGNNFKLVLVSIGKYFVKIYGIERMV